MGAPCRWGLLTQKVNMPGMQITAFLGGVGLLLTEKLFREGQGDC